MQVGAQAASGLADGEGSVSVEPADAGGCSSGMLAIDRGSVLRGMAKSGRLEGWRGQLLP